VLDLPGGVIVPPNIWCEHLVFIGLSLDFREDDRRIKHSRWHQVGFLVGDIEAELISIEGDSGCSVAHNENGAMPLISGRVMQRFSPPRLVS
jgi:hypothetical protein